ncbi:MAG: Glu/Leu/Phe/Val family dehydrogenase [Phycisphaeraceae bacterium]
MASTATTILSELGFRYDPNNLYQQTATQVLSAAELLEVPTFLQLILAQPKNELMVHFPVRMDDGSYRLFKGYRVQHNNLLGPYKGGMRFDPSVSLDDIKSLALLMTMKCALVRLPLGGGKGGVQINPRELSRDELMRLTRRFTSALGDNIGPDYDIPAPDVGTNAEIMGWMADTYMNITGRAQRSYGNAVVTGKPLAFGGSEGREKATGQGLVFVLEVMLPAMNIDPAKMTYSVIGFGNVGSWTARLLKQRGSTLTAVIDHTGAIRHQSGIDADALADYVQHTGGIRGYPDAEAIDTDAFYSHEVDLLVPAALEQMIDADRAEQINCSVLAEGANAPCTPQADRVLEGRGVRVLPAILCNSGGVTVSYFEWKQNRQAERWSAQHVDDELRRLMHAAADRVTDIAREKGCDMRTAAYCSALQYLDQVYNIRGVFP